MEAVLQKNIQAVGEKTRLHECLDFLKNKVCYLETLILLQVCKTIVFAHGMYTHTFIYKILYDHRQYEFIVMKYMNLNFYALFLWLVFVFTHVTCHIYLTSCLIDRIPILFMMKNKVLSFTIHLLTLLLWYDGCQWLCLHTLSLGTKAAFSALVLIQDCFGCWSQ